MADKVHRRPNNGFHNKPNGAVPPRRGFLGAIDRARALANLIAATLRIEPPHWRTRMKRTEPAWHRRGMLFTPNGARECERRRRQIAQGRLTEANGLLRGKWSRVPV